MLKPNLRARIIWYYEAFQKCKGHSLSLAPTALALPCTALGMHRRISRLQFLNFILDMITPLVFNNYVRFTQSTEPVITILGQLLTLIPIFLP